MYGTVFRFQIKPGKENEMQAFLESTSRDEGQRLKAAGMVSSYVYKLDGGGYMGAVVFQTKEQYVANANDPAQDAWYRRWRELLAADPEWNDGEVVWTD
jgi:hypothetical protein